MAVELADLNLTDAIEAAAVKFAGEKRWQHMDPLSKQTVKQQILEILLPTVPHLIKQIGQRAWSEGERHESEYLNIFGQFCPNPINPYDEYPVELPTLPTF